MSDDPCIDLIGMEYSNGMTVKSRENYDYVVLGGSGGTDVPDSPIWAAVSIEADVPLDGDGILGSRCRRRALSRWLQTEERLRGLGSRLTCVPTSMLRA